MNAADPMEPPPEPVPMKRRCKVIARTTGIQCQKPPMKGQEICATHGGMAPQNRRAARRRLAEHEVAQELERLKGRPISDVGELYELLAAVGGRVAAMIEVTAERVAELDSWSQTDVFGREEARAAVRMYGDALDRGTRYLSAMAKLDLEGRRLALDQRRAEVVVIALRAALALPPAATAEQREQRFHDELQRRHVVVLGGSGQQAPTPALATGSGT